MLKKFLLAAALSVASIFAFAQPYYPIAGLGLAGSATAACTTASAVLYNASTPCSTNLTFSTTGSVGAGPLLSVGTGSGTSAGLSFGYLLSGYGSIHPTAVTASALNYALAAGASQTVLNAGAGTLDLTINRSSVVTTILSISTNAGSGPTITGGTADGASRSVLNISQTRNYSAGATDYVKKSFTLTSTHASDNMEAWYGGAWGITLVANLTPTGKFVPTAIGFASGAVADSVTAPTIASGGCTSPAVTWNNGTAAFLLTVGTSCTGVKTIVLTMPAASNLWAVRCDNNTSDAAQQTNVIVARATSTTAVTLTSYDRVTGLQEDLTASDTYLCSARGG